jgi:hypothetical protein
MKNKCVTLEAAQLKQKVAGNRFDHNETRTRPTLHTRLQFRSDIWLERFWGQTRSFSSLAPWLMRYKSSADGAENWILWSWTSIRGCRGMTLLSAIHGCYETLPILIVTSEQLEYANAIAYANGARICLAKPLPAALLASAIVDLRSCDRLWNFD